MIATRCYSQNDLRWRFKKVGFGKGTFGYVPWVSGGVGCTVTALTGLLFVAGYDLTPDQVNEKLKAVDGFTGNLILWAKIPKAFPKVKFLYRYYKYNNAIVKGLVEKGTPVLVEVMTRSGKHWCLYLGDQKMLDPWDGRVKSTSTYNPIGFAHLEISK